MAEIKHIGQEMTDALSGKLTFEQDNNRIVGRDSANLVRLLVSATEGDFSFKVAKAGYDATIADDTQLVFNSNQNVLKVVDTGTVTLPGHTSNPATGQYKLTQSSVTITHDLGYQPVVVATTEGGGLVPRTAYNSVGTGAFTMSSINVTVTDTQVIFYLDGFGFNQTTVLNAINLRYYLLQETAN